MSLLTSIIYQFDLGISPKDREIRNSVRRCHWCHELIDFRTVEGKIVPINLDGSPHYCFQYEAGIPQGDW
jgi:hypothetical protein